jgi:hypothetical protein
MWLYYFTPLVLLPPANGGQLSELVLLRGNKWVLKSSKRQQQSNKKDCVKKRRML